MSFVNLMSNDVWGPKDITSRTEAMIHSVVSKQDENILSRKMIAFSMGLLVPSTEEAELLTKYENISYSAQMAGIAAQKDMELLSNVIQYEQALNRLKLPEITEPVSVIVDEQEVYNPEVEADILERKSAQDFIDSASQEIIDLYNLRNPVLEVTQEVIQEVSETVA